MPLPWRISALLTATAIAATAVVQAPAATAASTVAGDDTAVVSAWYTAFLDRPADAGAQYWVERLKVQAPGDVLWALTHTEEYDAEAITAYYRSLLGREPDRGARYWIDGANAQRFPLEWAYQNILASPEFIRAYRTRTDLVSAWYVFTFDSDRVPNDAEVDYWSRRISSVGYLNAYREVYYAPEAVSLRVKDQYLYLLSRPPLTEEAAYWYPKEVESDINVSVLIGATPEFRSLAG